MSAADSRAERPPSCHEAERAGTTCDARLAPPPPPPSANSDGGGALPLRSVRGPMARGSILVPFPPSRLTPSRTPASRACRHCVCYAARPPYKQRGGLKVRGHDPGGPARPATEVQARTTTARPGALRGRAQLCCGESVCPKNLLGLEADEHAEEEPRRTAHRLMQPVSRGPASWPPPSFRPEPAP